MAAIRTKQSGGLKPRERRVKESEPKSTTAKKSAQHKQTNPPPMAMAQALEGGELLVIAQFSELAPVAQYANVTLGPIQLAYKFSGVNVETLLEVDWSTEEALTDEQQQAYDLMRSAISALSKPIQHEINDDRELVWDSVRANNEREASEQKEKQQKTTRRRRS